MQPEQNPTDAEAERAYLASKFRDASGETITRENAAKLAEQWAQEGYFLPAALPAGFGQGWAAACDVIAKAFRWEGFHL